MGEISYPMPRTPRVGNRMTADWGGSLMRSMGSMRPVGVPGMMISRGYYGTRFTPISGGGTAVRAAAALLPWTVARFEATTIPGNGENAPPVQVAEGWCIYLPEGSATLYGAAVHLPAYEAAEGWYRIAGAESFGQGDDFQVVGHVKRRVVAGAATPSGDDAAPVLYASAHPWPTATAADATDVDLACAGDSWTATAARVAWSGSGADATSEVSQLWSGALVMEDATPGALELYWTTAAVGQTGWRTFTPAVQGAASAPLCGEPLDDVPLPIPATADETVEAWYHVDCSGATPEPYVDTADAAAADAYFTVSAKVYELRNGRLVRDLRPALAEQVYYP